MNHDSRQILLDLPLKNSRLKKIMSSEQEQRFYPELEMVERDVPCWYELSWQQNPQSLLLKIHQDFIQNSRSLTVNSPAIKLLSESFKFSNFGVDFSKNIGFGNVFKNRGLDERGMAVYQAGIPKVRKITKEVCHDCHGSKYDRSLYDKCFHCNGTGKDYLIDWDPAYALSASLTVLTSYLHFPKKETSANFPQLLTLETITESDMHGGSLWGVFGLKFHNFIKSQTLENLDQIIVSATKTVYEKMFGKRYSSLWKHDFGIVKWDNGGLCFDCPGDACGINPDYDAEIQINQGQGYKYSCHNVDTPMQQITLIAGLAALHDAARKEI